jgi:hypothetical protein
LTKADELLTKLYEFYHAEPESVSHAFMLKRLQQIEEKHDRLLTAYAELDDKHRELEERTAAFAKRINDRLRSTH